jgi:hypothetical protein
LLIVTSTDAVCTFLRMQCDDAWRFLDVRAVYDQRTVGVCGHPGKLLRNKNMIFCSDGNVTSLDDRRREIAERDFEKAVNEVLNRDNLTKEQMIELFDDDGYLGTAMRAMLASEREDDIAA